MSARWSPGAFAATLATALVAVTASWFPSLPSGLGAFLDAVINEWIIWFVVFYLSLVGAVSVAERVSWPRRVRRPADDHG